MTDLRTAAQQALEALEHHGRCLPWNAFVEVRKDLRDALAQQAEPMGQLAELQAMLRGEVDRLIAAGIQPQCKPLTEEEIEACRQQGYAHAGFSAPFDFGKAARAVEVAAAIKAVEGGA